VNPTSSLLRASAAVKTRRGLSSNIEGRIHPRKEHMAGPYTPVGSLRYSYKDQTHAFKQT
jgi:hypothetical protein